MYRTIHNAIYNFVDFFIREFTKEFIGAIFSIKFPVYLLRFIFWLMIYLLLVFIIFLMKLHGKILIRIISYINKYHQITQQPLLKCSALSDKGVSKNIIVVDVDLTTFKTHTEMYKVIHVLKSNWIWVALMCIPVIRFIISVKSDDVKKIEVEDLKVDDFRGGNQKINENWKEDSWKKDKFNWKFIRFSSELLDKILPRYLLFYKNQIIESEEKNEQFIIKRKNYQDMDHHHHHHHQHHHHYNQVNQQYQYNQEIISLNYWNLLFVIGIQLYGMIIIMSFRSILYLCFTLWGWIFQLIWSDIQ
ncbi:hypothetical protein C1645_740261 [Glomus cerebriforme]|uniref:Uncharacterized protein n=1 Tax=Glomus cerebriforme TaxID=658196 RepID=A0A397STG5_9GLOM|nr:hypothetical protein C1645_740261 [Glomus cerebriforme]